MYVCVCVFRRLEQVEGAAEKKNPLFEWEVGEAWSYRRVAYGRMADILCTCRQSRLTCGTSIVLLPYQWIYSLKIYCDFTAKDMHEEVYAVEPPETRHLHQVVTPPMSDAAREAREAFKSLMQDNEEYYLD